MIRSMMTPGIVLPSLSAPVDPQFPFLFVIQSSETGRHIKIVPKIMPRIQEVFRTWTTYKA